MSDHAIQFRRAWESPGGRIDLPIVWSKDTIARHLRRNFHRPTFDPAREEVILRLRDVSGLVVARLNGVVLELDPSLSAHQWLIQDRIVSTNRLELELAPERVALASPWGEIALVIRPLSPQGMEKSPISD